MIYPITKNDNTDNFHIRENANVFKAPKITIWKPSRKAMVKNMLKTLLIAWDVCYS